MKQLPSLNGLRAISITVVLLDHLLRLNLRLDPAILLCPLFDGSLGVNVFFVISGFLITYLLLAEENSTGTISIRKFYIRRVLRISPAYYFLLLVYACLQWLGYLHIGVIFWVMTLTYTRYIRILGEVYTAHAWSLSVEENFYLLWPTILKAFKNQRKNIALFFIFIVPFIRMFVFLHPIHWIGKDSLFVRIDAIAMGCYVALNLEELIAWLAPYWNRLFYAALIILFLLPSADLWAWNHGFGPVFVPFGVVNGLIANILISLIMLYSIYGPKGPWFKVLNSRPFNYIGILSYSIYLWQQIFLLPHPSWWVARFPQNLGCMFLAALFSHYFIEKPFLSLKSKFSAKRILAAAAPTNLNSVPSV